MDAIEAIVTRRSMRRYKDKPISDDTIESLLKAAMSAPSAKNEQPWHFIVLKDKETRQQIASFHKYAPMLPNAAVGILVAGEPQLEKAKGMWVQDCAAATQNILLAAHAQGLGAVWLGVYPKEKIITKLRELLQIPSYVIPFSIVSVGYPAYKKEPADRFKSDRVHHKTW